MFMQQFLFLSFFFVGGGGKVGGDKRDKTTL